MSSSRTTQLNKANRVISALAGIADITNLGLIFVFKQFFPALLEKSAQFALFPFAAAAAVIQALLSWNLVHINSGKDSGQILRAILGTLTAIAITAAVIIALAFGKTPVFGYELGQLVPIIFASTIGINALIHLATSAYLSIKVMRTKPLFGVDKENCLDKVRYPRELSQDKQALLNNLLSAGLGAEITATITTVMIYEQIQLAAALGGATALTGNALMLYLLYQQLRDNKDQDQLGPDAEAAIRQPAPVLLPLAAYDDSNSTCCLPLLSIFNRKAQHGYAPVPTTENDASQHHLLHSSLTS